MDCVVGGGLDITYSSGSYLSFEIMNNWKSKFAAINGVAKIITCNICPMITNLYTKSQSK